MSRLAKNREARINERRLAEQLRQARSLMRQRRWHESVKALSDIDRHFPQHPEVLRALIQASQSVGDHHSLHCACEKLCQASPNDPNVHYLLAGVYMRYAWAGLALHAARTALERDAGNPLAEQTRAMLPVLEELVADHRFDLGLADADGVECLVLHDRVRSLLNQGRFAKAAQPADELMKRRPEFTPAYNNGAEACYHDGRLSQAIDRTRRLLAQDPRNTFWRAVFWWRALDFARILGYNACGNRMAPRREMGLQYRRLKGWMSNFATPLPWKPLD